eukprot:CAMPEP_0119186522 /NCGR_PEP_ID=MMETSP1315-20130426/69057_1 /TAXON_ID=676789 /ORGANISM="Prasinoderma singularis, Strain RCC927" /LENGTH=1341 /DNA_ID=CAMNT_0007180959 /DNA_START=272 /DNA_END=4294 /DNA_ORIENTATION=+
MEQQANAARAAADALASSVERLKLVGVEGVEEGVAPRTGAHGSDDDFEKRESTTEKRESAQDALDAARAAADALASSVERLKLVGVEGVEEGVAPRTGAHGSDDDFEKRESTTEKRESAQDALAAMLNSTFSPGEPPKAKPKPKRSRPPKLRQGRQRRVPVTWREEAVPEEVACLPAWAERGKVLASLACTRAVCVAGETGSGKSTAIPIAIACASDSHRVVVAQPRRLAARALAARVAELMGVEVGGAVGFAVGQERRFCDATRVLYVTTGWLVNYLAGRFADGDTGDACRKLPFTHVVLDEAHERSLDADFLALMIKLAPDRLVSAATRVCVMSATLESDLYARYLSPDAAKDRTRRCGAPPQRLRFGQVFRDPSGSKSDYDGTLQRHKDLGDLPRPPSSSARGVLERLRRHAPAPQGPGGPAEAAIFVGARRFDVDVLYAEDLAKMGGKLQEHAYKFLSRNQPREGGLPPPRVDPKARELCVEAVRALLGDSSLSALIFAPGRGEIEDIAAEFSKHTDSECFDVIQLHSQAPPEEQDRALAPPQAGKFKVVVATNIAESSITIPDAYLVVDICMQREIEYSEQAHANVLRLKWASRASLEQRRGRAGRVRAGVCLRLLSEGLLPNLQPFTTSEMGRVALDGVVLRARVSLSGLGGATTVLSCAIDAPSADNVLGCLQRLQRAGALELGGDADTARPTAFGLLAVALPLELPLAKLCIIGVALGVPIDAVVLATAHATGQCAVFLSPCAQYERDPHTLVPQVRAAAAARLELAGGGLSDAMAARNACRDWLAGPRTYEWAQSRGLAFRRMLQWMSLVGETAARLARSLNARDPVEAAAKSALELLVDDTRRRGADNDGRGVSALPADEGGFCDDVELLRAALGVALCPEAVLVGVANAPPPRGGVKQRAPAVGAVGSLARGAKMQPARTVQLLGRPKALADPERLREAIEDTVGVRPTSVKCTAKNPDALVEWPAAEPSDEACATRLEREATFEPVTASDALGDLPPGAKIAALMQSSLNCDRADRCLRLLNRKAVVGSNESAVVEFANPTLQFDGMVSWAYLSSGDGPDNAKVDNSSLLSALAAPGAARAVYAVTSPDNLLLLGRGGSVLVAKQLTLLRPGTVLTPLLLLAALPGAFKVALDLDVRGGRIVGMSAHAFGYQRLPLMQRGSAMAMDAAALAAAERLRAALDALLCEGLGRHAAALKEAMGEIRLAAAALDAVDVPTDVEGGAVIVELVGEPAKSLCDAASSGTTQHGGVLPPLCIDLEKLRAEVSAQEVGPDPRFRAGSRTWYNQTLADAYERDDSDYDYDDSDSYYSSEDDHAMRRQQSWQNWRASGR